MSIPSMSGRLNMGQIVWSDHDFLRKSQIKPTDVRVIVVGEGRHDSYYMRYEVEPIEANFSSMDALVDNEQQCLLLIDSKTKAVFSVYEDGAIQKHDFDIVAHMGDWKCSIVGYGQHWQYVPSFGADWRTYMVRPESLALTGELPAWAAQQLDRAGIVDLKKLRRRLEDLIRKSPQALQAALASQVGAKL